MTANTPIPPQSVYIGLDTSNPDNPTLTYTPTEFSGNILASRNGIALQFFGSQPFAVVILGKIKGPVNDVKTPFGKFEVLKSVLDPDSLDYPWYIDPADTIVRIPPGKWGDYEFCYIVIMSTGLKSVPLLVSKDPKIIIGRQTASTGVTDPPPPTLTAEELVQLLFPGTPKT